MGRVMSGRIITDCASRQRYVRRGTECQRPPIRGPEACRLSGPCRLRNRADRPRVRDALERTVRDQRTRAEPGELLPRCSVIRRA